MSKYKVIVVSRESWYREYEVEAPSAWEAESIAEDIMNDEDLSETPPDDSELKVISSEEL